MIEPGCPLCDGAGVVCDPTASNPFGVYKLCDCQVTAGKARRIEAMRIGSGLGPLRAKSFASFTVEPGPANAALNAAVRVAESFAAEPSGWLVIAGPSGSGKTHLLAAIANRVVDGEDPVVFSTAADALDRLRGAFGDGALFQSEFEELANAPLLVLDDLPARATSDWSADRLDQLLDWRYRGAQPTAIVLRDPVGAYSSRIRSRISDPRIARRVDLPGASWYAAGDPLESPLLAGMAFSTFRPDRPGLKPVEQEQLNQALQAAKAFAARPDGWLIFGGGYGTGKTHLAAAIAHARRGAGHAAVFAIAPDLLDHLRTTFGPDATTTYDTLFEAVRNAELLILDDFGAQAGTPWANEKMYQIINYRYNGRLPTVFTTNKEIAALDPRVASRMFDKSISNSISFAMPDYRSDTPQRAGRPGARSR